MHVFTLEKVVSKAICYGDQTWLFTHKPSPGLDGDVEKPRVVSICSFIEHFNPATFLSWKCYLLFTSAAYVSACALQTRFFHLSKQYEPQESSLIKMDPANIMDPIRQLPCKQTIWTLIRLLLREQSDPDSYCLLWHCRLPKNISRWE